MKYKITTFLLITLAISMSVFSTACHHPAPVENANKASDAKPPATVEPGSVDFEGVRFSFDRSLIAEVKSDVFPGETMENADDEPAYDPKHIRFQFTGEYATRQAQAFFPPEIGIYKLADFKKTFAVSKEYVADLDKEVGKLKALLAQPTPAGDKEIPYLPFMDAAQAFRAHVKRVDFQNGKGLFFLTQYNQDAYVANNRQLTYIYQGLTDDGEYYIHAVFPVATDYLPDSDDATSHDGYTIPEQFYGQADKNQKAFDEYMARVEKRLNEIPANQYRPDLTIFDKMMGTLQIKK